MAITFVGSHVGTHAATSAQSVALSNLRNESNAQPSLAQGDVIVVAYVHSMATTASRTLAQCTPSGYTNAHASIIQANDSNAVSMAVSYKVMGASPDTTVSIPAAAATTNGVAYAIYAFRGVDAAVLDVTTTTATGSNTGVANAPAVTPSGSGAWIMVCGGAAVAAGAVFTNPTGLSATTNHFRSATITTTTNDANVGVGLKTDWSSGAFDPAAFGGSTSTNTGSWAAATLALKAFVPAITGTLNASESGSDTFAASGAVADPAVTGSLAAQETGSDTVSISGGVTVSGSLGATSTGTDTASASGSVGVLGSMFATSTGTDAASVSGSVAVAGAMAASETGADTAAATGAVPIAGTLAGAEAGSDGFAGSGSVQPDEITGTLSASESGNDTASFSGMALLTALLDVAETGSDAFSADGLVEAQEITGSLAATEEGEDHADVMACVIVTGFLDAEDQGTDLMVVRPVSASRVSSAGKSARTPQLNHSRPVQREFARPVNISGGVR